MPQKNNAIEAGIVAGIRHLSSRKSSATSERNEAVISLRPSQKQAFEKLRAVDLGILNAPTGWGKSLVLCTLAGDDLLSDPCRKAVFCIPQTIIAKGFISEAKIELPARGLLNWGVRNNLCAKVTEKVDQLLRFLRQPAERKLPGRVVVTTHLGLAAAFRKLKPDQLCDAISNTTFVFDEAHHVHTADDSGNQLGDVVRSLLESSVPSVRLLLATAYFFRGDKLPILEDRHLDRFERHMVPFDEHWRALKHLSSYQYDFVAYKGTVWKPLETLLCRSQEPTIIYCPPEGHRLLMGKPKEAFTQRVIRLLKKHYGAEPWLPEITAAKPVILDLVDTQHRAEKVRFAMEKGEQLAAILTVGMFREGADWLQAQRVIDLIPTSSDQDRNQRFGRLIRDYPGKDNVSYYSFFPQITKQEDGKQRDDLTKLYAHFHASLVLENALAPINVMPKADSQKKDGEKRGRPMNLLGQFDEQTQEAIVTDCHEALLLLHSDAESSGTTVTYDEARNAMVEVLKRYEIKQQEEPMAKQIVLMLRRRANLNLPVMDLVEAGFDKVWSSDALEGIRLYSAGFCGPENFREIRRVIMDVFNSRWLEMYEQIKELPALPSPQGRAYWWIQNNKSFYRDGRLSVERINLLEAIPWWEWQRSVRDRWGDRYEQLSKLNKCPSSGTKEYDWVRHQRRMQEQGRLSDVRVRNLEQIPWWTWNNYAKQFEDRIEQLRRLDSPPKSRTKEYEFAKYFRKRKQQGKLEPERIEELDSIPWWTW